MKTSWHRLEKFSRHADVYMAQVDDTRSGYKLRYAISRVLDQIERLKSDVQQRLAEIEIDHCMVGSENGVKDIILRDGQGKLRYTKEGMVSRNAEQATYLGEDNFELEPYFATLVPDNMSAPDLFAFEGIVIAPEVIEGLFNKEPTG